MVFGFGVGGWFWGFVFSRFDFGMLFWGVLGFWVLGMMTLSGWGLDALGYTVSFWAGAMDVLVWVLCGVFILVLVVWGLGCCLGVFLARWGWCNMCFEFVLVVLWVSCLLFGFGVVLVSGFGLVLDLC